MPETYDAISTTECLPTKPVKTSLMLRFRANLLAYLERDDTAPLGKSYYIEGRSNGVAQPVSSHAKGMRMVIYNYNQLSVLELSSDGGSTWPVTVSTFGKASLDSVITFEVDWEAGNYKTIGMVIGDSIINNDGTFTPLAVNAFRVSNSGGVDGNTRFFADLHGGWK